MPRLPSLAQTSSPNWLIRSIIGLALSAVLILLLGQYTDLDLWLADLYFDPAIQRFPWDKTWFATTFMHGYVKNVLMWIGFILMAGALVDLAFPLRFLTPARRAALRISALSAFFEPLMIYNLKRISALHCPWGVDRYAGHHPFLRLLDVIPADWSAGHCFPAGHASSAMWLSALAAFWLPRAPARARGIFALGILAGFTLGWVQQMRGQHFLSHTLWTAWLSSALIIALFAVFARPLGLASPSRSKDKAAAPVGGTLPLGSTS